MKSRTEMLEQITKALEDAGYEDVHSIYWLMIGFGLIEEEQNERQT